MAAERALSAEFECQGANTLEERAMFVQFLLGDPDDISSKHCPFLWKSAYKASEDDEPNKFQVRCTYTRPMQLYCSLIIYFVGLIPRASGHTNIS
jgi:hypothetical protein